jgi:CubicO group peptidase (beta-lactamase class C family)
MTLRGVGGKRLQLLLTVAISLSFVSAAWTQQKAPTNRWPVAQPSTVGLDEKKLAVFGADVARGEYGLVDSLLVIRCGKQAFARTYSHDYGKIYSELAKKEGPLNHDLNGPYNYFSPRFHPYYQGSDLHTMQSVSKTVTSITIGIARGRKEFPVDLDTPILKFFDNYRVANIDERKRGITLRHLLTMTAGLAWNEDLPYNDPKNSADLMEATHDWVHYVINQPMAAEPGKVFEYSSGVTELLAHIFKRVTGRNVDEYAAEYLFKPLGIRYHWKHEPAGLPDTEGGLYLSTADLGKIGFLFLQNGVWGGKQIVPQDWVKASVSSDMFVEDEDQKWKYGFQWWLQPYGNAPVQFAWAARGFGGQELRVLPKDDLIFVSTGWSILPETEGKRHDQLARILAAVDRQYRCEATRQ